MSDAAENGAGKRETGGELPALRRRLLAGVLRHAPFDGWSERALAAAARDEGVALEMAHIAFQGGPAEIAEFFSTEADRQMVEAVRTALFEAVASPPAAHVAQAGAAQATPPATGAAGGLKIRERVALAVRTRLLQLADHREALRALAAFLAMPAHAGLAARCLWRTVDAMWYAIGDTSTDFNYYSKRVLLAGVYGSTFLVWLDDSSEGFDGTFAFLDRRIADVMAIERGKARLRESLSGLFRRAGAMGPRPRRDYSPPGPQPGPQPGPPSTPSPAP